MDHSYTKLSIQISERKICVCSSQCCMGLCRAGFTHRRSVCAKVVVKINSESQSSPCFVFAMTEPQCVSNTLYKVSRNRVQEGKREITSVSKYFMPILNFNWMLAMWISLYAAFDCAGLWGCSLLLYLPKAHCPYPCNRLVSAVLLLAGTNMVVVEEERLELLFQVASLVLPSNLRCQGGCDMWICVH